MSFGDGLTMIPIFDEDSVDIAANAATAVLFQYVMPVHFQVEVFGVYITADFAAAGTDPRIDLNRVSKVDGTETSLETLVLGNSNAKALKRGDGSKAGQTAITADTDLDNGQVVLKNMSDNHQFAPGDVLEFRVGVQGSDGTGKYIPFVLGRFAGPDVTSPDVWIETT
jgi:hypothetical protein